MFDILCCLCLPVPVPTEEAQNFRLLIQCCRSAACRVGSGFQLEHCTRTTILTKPILFVSKAQKIPLKSPNCECKYVSNFILQFEPCKLTCILVPVHYTDGRYNNYVLLLCRIRLSRMAELLALSEAETEDCLSDMVTISDV